MSPRLLAGVLFLVASTSCGGVVVLGNATDGGKSGADGGRPDGTTAHVDSGSVDGGSGEDASGDSGDSGPRQFLSCDPGGAGMTNCGASSESCCTSLEVPGGTYYRTYRNSGSGPTAEADPATVSGFRLDKYQVTVGRFRQFVTAWDGGAGYLPPAGSGRHTHLNGGLGLTNSGRPGTYETGWSTSWNANIDMNLACDPHYATWTDSAGKNENLPINCANWYEAYAFCIWDGGFLASEAEWGYAAAGGNQQREYPWGSTDPGRAYQYAIYGCLYPYPTEYASCNGFMNIAPVGTATLGAGLWSQLDIEGNVMEFVLDWSAPYMSACTDCAYLAASSNRAIRGADCCFYGTESNLQAWGRNHDAPTSSEYYYGFRCARTP